ncbi:bifunctional 5,10-methylene-tetrahydrofolate dehydrogenase/5,10-methylene-tetrahydrofolate cyclohydrolase [Bacillaceae bacterium SIJ1]|uniref:bifunctional 5,10-methylenetetrahydrofolate dehydrogenase/5,10-methenyltetrahydrofolate cyclohydrolase n=1 Tax=Litoribacterium kuwaitense TaxID=1398745 RepID=UPI0013EBFD2B|nr:tetrahydrofolate dehydrogenase/cyclohydrolase catalytic domain-containing protein [Litoribacterium kuwaitense]NGP45892.1 bifunctional 5,10-methylene-tetrahydrofolate dehydrogenase/5,10-methylene-tetrahydrofolate cyclohydrolase [Litoribacterium kuwaitense]
MGEPVILDGRKVAQAIREDVSERASHLKQAKGITPCLATILVGDDPSSATYVKMKGKACEKVGIDSKKVTLPADITQDDLMSTIQSLNDDPAINGILLQHPIPSHLDERAAFEAIDPEKDVDGVTSASFGRTGLGFGQYPSCTPGAIISILDYYDIPLEGKHAVVVGRSPILGKPVSLLLLNRNATVTICHSRTVDVAAKVAEADVVVAAVGKPEFVKGHWIKEGAVVVDAGYNPGNIGDVEYDASYQKASAITPVPGGVGPVTIATLLKQTMESAEKSAGLNKS